ncbi:unnamed protein product [Somion occarium]|uniref:GmrSD restriction endonucleases N-terminal domain-containing protein n=1 Tax=Somion occarium TaxID=3059160 RepID=A0ABP1D1L9_9APHY
MSSLSDFESDLTDLESSEDEYRPAPGAVKQPSKRKPPKQEYRLNNTLSPPRNTSYPAMALYNQLKNGLINLDPEYQRGVVWADSKQSYLIDSLFRNYYIPPIIFAVTRTSDGLETRVCIDGKQRLTSIMKFMEGEICHKDSYTGERLWFKQPSSTKKPLLPKQYILQFENKQIPCVEYDTLNDDQEREIFQRVQMGVALTPAERMQALTGQYPDLARDIQKMISGDEGFSDSLEWRDSRGRDFQCIASMIYLVDSKSNVKFPGAPTLDKWLQENREVDNNFRSSILNTFNTYITLAKDARYNACFQSRKVSPVEFTMAAVLIHRYKSTFSMDRLSASIKSMREHVRNEHEDIRANAKVALTITNFIDNDLKKIKPQKGEITATEFMKKLGATAKASKSSKRKRVESTDDEGDEVLRKPPKSSTAGTKRSVTLKIPAKSTAKPTTSSSMSSGVARQVAKRSQPVGQSSPSVTTASKSRVGSGTTVQTVSVKKEKVASSGGKVTSTTQRQKESTSRTQEIARPKPSSSKNPTPGDEGPDAASYTTRARPPTPRKEHVRPSAAGSGHIASTSRASPLQPKQSSSATPPIPGPSPEVKSFAPTSSVSAVANGVMKNEPSRKVSPITTSADGKPDRLAAIRRAKEEQQQRRMSSDAGKAGSSRQGSTSLPATPVTPFQPPPFSQQPLTQSPVTDQNHSKQLPQQMIPQANTSPALLPAAPKPSDIFVLPSGEKLDYQYVVDVLASLSQSPQAATAQAPNLVPAAADPRLARQSPSVTSPSLSRNRTAQEDEDMEIDTPPPQQLPPISPKSNVQPAPVPEAPASQLTPAPASAPAPAPQPAPQNQQSTNPLSFLRQSPVLLHSRLS